MKSLTDLQKMRVELASNCADSIDWDSLDKTYYPMAYNQFLHGFDASQAEMLRREEVYKSLVSKMKESLQKISELPKGESISDLDGWYAKRKAEAILVEVAEIEKGLG